MTDQVKTGVSEAEFMRPENEWFEVINGELVEIEFRGLVDALIASNLYDILKPYVKLHRLGFLHHAGLTYILYANDQGVQSGFIPDLAFIRAGRISSEMYHSDYPFPGAPDLAVEVISPGQGTPDILDKAADYLKYGTEEVWVIYPIKRELHRYQRGEEAPEIYNDTQSLQTALFPGLMIRVADLFVVEEG